MVTPPLDYYLLSDLLQRTKRELISTGGIGVMRQKGKTGGSPRTQVGASVQRDITELFKSFLINRSSERYKED